MQIPQEIREQVAQKIADIRGLVQWENLPDKQTAMSGCACKEICFMFADQIISIVMPSIENKARKDGYEESTKRAIEMAIFNIPYICTFENIPARLVGIVIPTKGMELK